MEQVINFLFNTIISVFGSLFEGISGLLTELLTPSKDHSYHAGFIPVEKIARKRNCGFMVTGRHAISTHLSYSNLACFGASGSGKSTSVTINSIYSLSRGNSSIAINDPSGEVYAATAGYLQSQGYTIHQINFSNSESPDCFNPLARCRSISDIQRVAHLLLQNTLESKASDPFWERSAVMLITLFGRYLHLYASPEFNTMFNLLRLLECFVVDCEKTDRLFIATRDEDLITSYKSMLVLGAKTLQSVVATARAALSNFSDEELAKTTSFDSIDFSTLRKEKVAIYICNPISQAEYLRPITAVFFQSLFNECMSYIPNSSENSVFILLDEAGSVKFNSLSITISNIRKHRAGIMLLLQDYNSLISLYGQAEAHNIRTNCYTQIYLPGQPLETCRELEGILGRYSYVDGTVERARQLMTADEIRISREAIILCGNYAPMRTHMRQYFEIDRFRRYASMQPYTPTSKTLGDIPVLPLS